MAKFHKVFGIRGSIRFDRDWIGERADLFDLDTYGVAGLEPARRLLGHTDAMRRARQDDCAGQQRRAATQKLDQRRHIEDHVVGVPILHDLTV